MNNQMNSAVRKIHNLLSSGAVTVTGPNQPRILKQKIVGSGATATTVTTASLANNVQQQQQVVTTTINRCYVCDDALGANQAQHQLTEMQTTHTTTKFPNKIGQLVGDAFMVIVSVEDVVCSRCTNLINYLDRLENDVERVRTNLMNLLHKKYGLNDDSGGIVNAATTVVAGSGAATPSIAAASAAANVTNNVSSSATLQAPPNKLQKLNSGAAVSAVQQMKISTQSPTNIQQQSAGTQTLQRKTTKIYKCLSCDYKTSDMRLFNTHYETCKHQNFQCKNCKKIFPNFGAMKQHMVREHNTPMDNTCAVCHINFVSESALRKHMEINHSTNVVVTSTTTLPVSQNAAPAADSITAVNAQASPGTTTTPLYTCNHCQFKSTDKISFDEHMRKHMSGVKSKPFKCRLCAQRFETREAATTHAKQHQGNVFKCGTCSMSFPKREMLVKHFEEHQQQQNTQQLQQQQQVQQQQMITIKQQQAPQASQNMLTTQKLLQDTIDEALSDSTTPVTTTPTTDVTGAASANNIRFFSCHICSLTFIQENYYNQHMETHRRGDGSSNTATTTAPTHKKTSNTAVGNNSLSTLNAAALLSEAAQQETNDMVHHNAELNVHHQQQLQQQQQQQHQQQTATLGNAGNNTISEADIESIFEKMHSDKGDAGVTATTTSSGNGGGSNDQVVITSQAGSGGGITFNITIPGQEGAGVVSTSEDHTTNTTTTTTAPVSVSIDMPMLDQPDDSTHASTTTTTTTTTASTNLKAESPKPTTTGPVSMPSLDDDNEEQQPANQTTNVSSENSKNLEEPVQHNTEETAASASKQPATDDGANKTEESSANNHPAEQQVEDQTAHENTATTDNQQTESVAGDEAHHQQQQQQQQQQQEVAEAGQEQQQQQQQTHEHHELAAGGEAGVGEGEQQQHVAMELDEATMQAQVDGGQIKFILNESGQLLQLDNHILTDADGNQILVQDPEHIQQLLQSVGVLQSGEGLDGETLQMMTDANGQMVLVQGENNETQLIDASLLNAEGQLVIQQSQDGDGGAHVIGEDGTRIPVSVSYTEDGQPIVQVQQQVLEAAAAGGEAGVMEKDASGVEGNDHVRQGDDDPAHTTATTTNSGSTTSSGFFALEELMQQQSSSSSPGTATASGTDKIAISSD